VQSTTAGRFPIELRGIELRGIELNGMELRGIELNGLLARFIELRGIELSGEELKSMELSGMELSGMELSGTPANANDSRVTLVEESVGFIPKSAQLEPTTVSSEHQAAIESDPLLTPPSPIELSGVAPSSMELSGIELSGLEERSRAPRFTDSRFAAATGFSRTSASVTV
jgi:hypothetical protein